MSANKRSSLLFLLAAAGWLGGCGSSNSGPTSGSGDWLPLKVGNRWNYQLTDATGAVSAKVQSVTAQEPVGGTGPNQAMTAFKLVTGNSYNDPNGDVSYQALVGSRLVRLRELSVDGMTGAIKKEETYADPWKLRLDISDAHTTKGATWPESYTQFEVDAPKLVAGDGGAASSGDGGGDGGDGGVDGGAITTMAQVTDLWSVVAVNEVVKVPAGTFKALVVRRMANSGVGSDKTFWFVRGIGKVKETGVGDQTEELTGHQFP